MGLKTVEIDGTVVFVTAIESIDNGYHPRCNGIEAVHFEKLVDYFGRRNVGKLRIGEEEPPPPDVSGYRAAVITLITGRKLYVVGKTKEEVLERIRNA